MNINNIADVGIRTCNLWIEHFIMVFVWRSTAVANNFDVTNLSASDWSRVPVQMYTVLAERFRGKNSGSGLYSVVIVKGISTRRPHQATGSSHDDLSMHTTTHIHVQTMCFFKTICPARHRNMGRWPTGHKPNHQQWGGEGKLQAKNPDRIRKGAAYMESNRLPTHLTMNGHTANSWYCRRHDCHRFESLLVWLVSKAEENNPDESGQNSGRESWVLPGFWLRWRIKPRFQAKDLVWGQVWADDLIEGGLLLLCEGP
jgi:hypothetical protein